MDAEHDIIVVGAGMAGLAAAYELGRTGHRPLVLERAASAGGRIRTVSWRDARLELGAMWVNPGYRQVLALIAELGLADQLVPLGDLVMAIRRDGRWHHLDLGRPGSFATTGLVGWRDRLSLVRGMLSAVPVLPRLRKADFGDLAPVARMDGRAVTDVFTPGAVRVLAGMEANLGYRPEEISYALFLGMFGPAFMSPGISRPIRIGHGMSTLADRLAEHCTIQCGVAVERVETTGARVVLHAQQAGERRRYEAAGVILATTADVAARLWPEPPAFLGDFLRTVRYSSVNLLYLRTAQPYRVLTRTGKPLVQEIVPAADRDAEDVSGLAYLNEWAASGGLLMTGNRPAAAGGLPAATDELTADRLQAQVEAYHPDLRGAVVDRFGYHRPHFAPLFVPGYVRRLTAVCARLRPSRVDVAGDYLRAPFLEGAYASGVAAARRMRRFLGVAPARSAPVQRADGPPI